MQLCKFVVPKRICGVNCFYRQTYALSSINYSESEVNLQKEGLSCYTLHSLYFSLKNCTSPLNFNAESSVISGGALTGKAIIFNKKTTSQSQQINLNRYISTMLDNIEQSSGSSSDDDLNKKAEKRKSDSKDESGDSKKAKIDEHAKTDKSASGSNGSNGEIDFLQRIKKRRTDVCSGVDKFKFNKKRVRVISKSEEFSDDSNGVVYWMARDHRVQDNWAFLYAQRLALKLECPLYVCYCLVPQYLGATIRQYQFMLKGLAQVEKECRDLNIPFHLLLGTADKVLPDFVKQNKIGGIVTDFNPLRTNTQWVNDLKATLPRDVPLCQVDAHNIVPCWEASPKLEYGARTIRKKIHDQLDKYLTEFPPMMKHPYKPSKMPELTDWKAADKYLEVDRNVPEVTWAAPGSEAGLRTLESFCMRRIKAFAGSRNDPNKQALSNLSPWIHFGQVSVQRCVLMVKLFRNKSNDGANAFIEEAVIRRELADNFCYYNEHYDSIKGAYKWAQDTLQVHSEDKRKHVYDRDRLEHGKTHDDLWNAAQMQLVTEGKQHGFLRMYWAKKILEWTPSPEIALEEAIYLNDKYSLDGRDPNGYVGCMWSIAGIHDQGWAERPVFGKIRYMNYEGCKRKFNVSEFVSKYRNKKLK